MDTVSVLLLAAFVIGYLVLAGADVGLGLLMPRVARTPDQRRGALAAIAPYFLASEVWLVAALGVLAGLFPSLEHHVVAHLWPALAALALALLVRDAGLWMWRRVPSARWRALWEGAVIAGSWGSAVCWGLVVAGLLTGSLWSGVFTPLCAAAVVVLFALRGASFGADRLVAEDGGRAADACGELTRTLSRWALAAVGLAAVAALLPGGPRTEGSVAAGAALLLLLGSLAVTAGVHGPMLSRVTSALAIAVPGVLVALVADLPVAPVPATTGILVWANLAPFVPVMFLGQVWLYRMTRRSAGAETFFA
ncbi:cytochrome d ubiquinol oxidase subunit II [Nocardiopsis sp. HNM0947]|uniref:Cytochrome d ubiquinol oxidase subunit II n=1 Tax=Nocardiopsis coralli TaxID=2772213 RepID=A0ABR9PE25_9ACTN|nr:cytochrome d ubiquinol oxidase subunit II [Nocardiopsis coralli]MBE3002074.1 cytochrome d ubiquinol oxidase subunit II [Nocardiopsis coralli]